MDELHALFKMKRVSVKTRPTAGELRMFYKMSSCRRAQGTDSQLMHILFKNFLFIDPPRQL